MRPSGTTKYNYDGLREVLSNGIVIWERNCPKCNKVLQHKCKYSARQCYRQKRVCASCGSWTKGQTKDTNPVIKSYSQKHSEWLTNFRKTNPPWNVGLTKETSKIIEKYSNDFIGFKHSDETKEKIGKHSKELWKNPAYRNDVIEKVKKIIGDPKHIAQWRLKMERNGWFTPLALKSEFEKYKCEVWNITRKQNLDALPNYNNRGRSKYHLDHKYSITQGFLNDVPSEIVGHISNLEMLYHKDNIRKNSKCSTTKESLLENYYATC